MTERQQAWMASLGWSPVRQTARVAAALACALAAMACQSKPQAGHDAAAAPSGARSAGGPAGGADEVRASGASAPARPFDEAAALRLPFREFGQTPDSGWRVLANEERWAEAGRLIDRYLAQNPSLTPYERMVLSFHAGQMYGFAGENQTARYRFMDALIPNESPNAVIRWNAYMLATIAFLEGDRPTLLQSREVILAGPTVEGCKPNLNIVNSFVANFGKPYKVAYQASGPPTMD